MRLSLADGNQAKVCELSAPPVWDGMAISEDGLFIALRNGKVMKLGQ